MLAASPAAAQQDDEQLWLQANTNIPVAPRLRLTLEQIARYGDRPDGLFQSELGVLFSVPVGGGLELGAGYRRVGFHNRSAAPAEDRLRQQIVGTFGKISFRFRVDERFNRRGSEIGFRVRPLVRFNQKIGKHGLALFVSHESFLIPNSTSWGQKSGYERMRNIFGLTTRIVRGATADIGYLNQYRPGRGRSRGQMDHALSVQLNVSLRDLVAPLLHD